VARNKRLVWPRLRWFHIFHRSICIFWFYKNWNMGIALRRRLQSIFTLHHLPVSLLLDILEPLEMHDF